MIRVPEETLKENEWLLLSFDFFHCLNSVQLVIIFTTEKA